jgi:DNA-binding NarL/FixJ family response regulator
MTTTAQVSRRPRAADPMPSRWVRRTAIVPRLVPVPDERPVSRPVPPQLSRLTDRERTILLAMATGATNAEIAAELYVSVATVKTHVARVLAKLGLRDRVQAVVFAYESRIVVPR